MGGNSEGIGNASVAAEFNFHADPEAAHVVLEAASAAARCLVTVVPWETCYKVRPRHFDFGSLLCLPADQDQDT